MMLDVVYMFHYFSWFSFIISLCPIGTLVSFCMLIACCVKHIIIRFLWFLCVLQPSAFGCVDSCGWSDFEWFWFLKCCLFAFSSGCVSSYTLSSKLRILDFVLVCSIIASLWLAYPLRGKNERIPELMNRLDEFVASGCHSANSVAEAWILDPVKKIQ